MNLTHRHGIWRLSTERYNAPIDATTVYVTTLASEGSVLAVPKGRRRDERDPARPAKPRERRGRRARRLLDERWGASGLD
jgi:hypothetical protein